VNKRIALLLTLLVLTSLLMGCGATPAPRSPPAPTAAPTQAPAPTEAAAAAPTAEPMGPHEGRLILATTSSTQDSGLLDYLLPDFEQQAGVRVDVIAVGTGQALKLGEDGNADVLLVHSRAKEDEFMAAGHGVRREDVMYNDFVIVGPQADPAGIRGLGATDALKRLAETKSVFVSRGDESGTHTKEKAIWKAAGIEPAGNWYLSAGDTMGATLTMAMEKQGYTLSDRATYLARTKEGLDLVILVEGEEALFNPYGVIVVNPAKNPNIRSDLATQFVDWIISVPTQEKIAGFGLADFGQSLFVPDSTPWREAQAAKPAGGREMPADAALKITGIATPMGWTLDQLGALDTLDVPYTNKKGETTTYTGVLLADLLNMAGVQSAATLTLVAGDGYTVDTTMADVQGCADCIVAFDNGSLRAVMPPFGSGFQVKDLREIQVK
jgi:tungstate transport system substrate-binding protein